MRWDYSPAPESTDHVRLRDRYGLFIGGEFVEPRTGPTRRRSTRRPRSRWPRSRRRARPTSRARSPRRGRRSRRWAALPGLERGKYVFRIARLIQERARELAVVETLDGGKPIKESRDVDVPLAAAHFFYYAGWADKLEYGVARRARCAPRGVVGQVIPWNFPLLMAAWKLAPALATGNTAVLKPADTTPLTALLLAEIVQEAELPDGVVNILPGDGRAGAALVRADGIDKVAFTGSTAVGRDIQAALAGKDIGLTLELGGKSANIVFEDAALDQAVEGIVQGIFFNQGHVCCAGLAAAGPGVGRRAGRSSGCGRGCRRCASATRWTRTPTSARSTRPRSWRGSASWSARASQEGAGLRQVACALPDRGYWFAPALFTEVSPAHRIAREEIFGPVLTVTTFRTHAEAIEKANNSPYGLAAGIWTDKGSKAFEVAAQLQAGVVWQNTYNHFDPTAAFGGFKESGFGREGGAAGLRPYVRGGVSDVRVAVAKTYKLYVGGAFVRSESGRHDAVGGSTSRAARARTCATRSRPRARRRPAGRRRPPTTAARSCTGRPRRWSRARARVRRRRRRGRRRAVHYAGWTDKLHAVLGGVNPVAAPFLSMSTPEPTGVVAVLCGADDALPAWSRRSPRRWPPATPSSSRCPSTTRCPGSTSARSSASPTSRAASSTCSPAARPSSSRRCRPPRRQRDHRRHRRRRPRRRDRPLRLRDAQARHPRRRLLARRLEALTELRTVWHPVGA